MAENLVNNEASFCSSIPIHQITSIQPQGVLIVAGKDLKVIQASENAGELFDAITTELQGKGMDMLLDKASYDYLKSNCSNFNVALPVSLVSRNGQRLSAIIHEKNEALFMEIEHPDYFSNDRGDIAHFFRDVRQLMSVINNCRSVEEVASVTAREIKKLSGFDKVMVYSFDEDWVGTVIAEEKKDGMESYMGLKFPSTDIPKQARDLYIKNPYRLIPDRNFKPVPLIPGINPLTKQPSDLSDCKFRGVMNVHLEYLKNMNVVASMSTRIIHKERLWGLIACHHTTPKFLSFNECAFFEFVSGVVSSKIASLLYLQTSQKEEYLQSHYNDIINTLHHSDDVDTAFDDIKDQLLLVLEADGIVIYRDEKIFAAGKTPDEDQVVSLVEWLATQNFTATTQFQALSYHYEAARQFSDEASGLLVLPVQPYEGNYVLGFRSEAEKKVLWGGDPNQVLTFTAGKTNYHPRTSFERWKEVVRYTAEPWVKEEMDIAEKLRIALVEFTLKKISEELK